MSDPSLTRTLAGVRPKDSDVVECIGSIDEANAFIGLAKVFVNDEELRQTLEEIQRTMFRIGAEVSSGKAVMSEEDYSKLIELISRLESEVELPDAFLILETNEASAFLSVARTVVRRAERRAAKLYRNGKIRVNIVEWLNKLSYLLYLMVLKTMGERKPV
ncbi:ATP:cob(I)alamin adenosyltransferase [Archaeoglobus veneficus]|uniref:Cobalamin adenosyltransferase n=1 Tax=Archaeoglobus veneficus (strain DSM 11195 / SNP6) TaxID=693661 RepID=F2KNW1_ARCVS|nr:cobalamin adenosyltransferase [Archaeoglobus veneficus]AEA47438.1 cobalamin adenosyltransferase [Archaeoglobus veneficus SNP6]